MTQNTIVNGRTGPVLANCSVSRLTSSSTCGEYEMLLGELLVVLVEASTVKIPHPGGVIFFYACSGQRQFSTN